MRARKAVDQKERGDRERLGEDQGGKTIIRIYYMRRDYSFKIILLK